MAAVAGLCGHTDTKLAIALRVSVTPDMTRTMAWSVVTAAPPTMADTPRAAPPLANARVRHAKIPESRRF